MTKGVAPEGRPPPRPLRSRGARLWAARFLAGLQLQAGRLRTRLLLVNLLVVLVPVVGLEFARTYERQLLNALERDMHNQAVLVREMTELALTEGTPLDAARHEVLLTRAAKNTRTRIRLLQREGQVVADSHRYGPPEGREPPAPQHWPSLVPDLASDITTASRRYRFDDGAKWPQVPQRREVKSALVGTSDSYTRIRASDPSVLLFHARPIRHRGVVVGAVYLTRSTQPVMFQLYRIRSGLIKVLLIALVLTAFITVWLAWSISRPLSRLVTAARKISAGQREVEVPVGGSGEVRQLGLAFRHMTRKLDGRMRYITQFTADVTHELKSPLTSIQGAAELLAEGAAEDPAARQRFLGNIQLDVERLNRLVSRLLELSRIEAAAEEMAEVELGALIVRVIKKTHTKDQPVLWLDEDSHPAEGKERGNGGGKAMGDVADQGEATLTQAGRLYCRAGDVERALLNLVENGLRFSPAGEPVIIRLRREAQWLSLSVADSGPGVAEHERERIFDRFYTTDAERSGTGLGLAIVRSVARSHGGEVSLVCPEAGGAVFTMRLAFVSPSASAVSG